MADWFIPIVKPIFPSVRWTTGSDDVWLTFDDGPHPTATPAVLDALQREGELAGFFVLGQNVEKHPDLVRRMRDEGHLIGHHAYEHRPVWFRARESVGEQLRKASDIVEKALGVRPCLFRPPYGRLDPSTPVHARAVGLRITMFTVNSWDFAGGSPVSIADRVIRRTRPGDIILLHDNDRTALFAGDLVTQVIRKGRQAGLKFGKPIE